MFDLTGKKAIVTGGSRGLGWAMAMGLHQAGAEVAIIDIDEQLTKPVDEVSSEGAKLHFVKGNLAVRKDLQQAFREAVDAMGGLNILVNNAGLLDRRPARELDMEGWDRVLEVNISAVFHLCKLAGEIMIPQGSGKIINIGSVLSIIGGFNSSAYSVSKGGIAQLTKSLSNEWAASNIQINAIAPGYFETNMNSDLLKNTVRVPQINARIPAGRWGKPEDLAGAAVFLASDASNYVSGVVLPVDGGYLGR